jgi:hypothetical protein
MKPGDKIVVTESNHPIWPQGTEATLVKQAFDGWMARFTPPVAPVDSTWWVHNNHFKLKDE